MGIRRQRGTLHLRLLTPVTPTHAPPAPVARHPLTGKKLPLQKHGGGVFCSMGGVGGSRTRVQTGKPYAFYTLISDFIFVLRQDLNHQPQPYPLKSHTHSEACKCYSRFYLHRLIFRFGTTSSERCLVPLPRRGIKPVIYCTSIRQRERSCFRQLIFCSLRLRR